MNNEIYDLMKSNVESLSTYEANDIVHVNITIDNIINSNFSHQQKSNLLLTLQNSLEKPIHSFNVEAAIDMITEDCDYSLVKEIEKAIRAKHRENTFKCSAEIKRLEANYGKHLKNIPTVILPQKNVELQNIHTASELSKITFPAINWIVYDLIPTGLTLLSGKPKIGKSWLCLDIAISVSMLGSVMNYFVPVQAGVLYLSLEDNKRRLQSRIKKMLPYHEPPNNLHLCNECPRIDEGGLDAINNFLNKHKDVKLVIVDTLAKVRHKSDSKQSIYDSDYQAMSSFKKIADDRDIAVIVIHHNRKMGSDDVYDLVSGTIGLTGAPDTIIVLSRERSRADGTLHVSGRDIQENDLALSFNDLCQWSVIGNAEEFRMSKARQEIIDMLRQSQEAMSPSMIAQALNKKAGTIKMTLSELLKDGFIKKEDRGLYIYTN